MKIISNLKKISKKFLSIVLCVSMLATTFCFFDIGSLISKAMVSNGSHALKEAGASNNAFSTYAINMPELVYLKPGKNVSDCFLNNNSNGTVDGITESMGIFSFSCSTAKSISISAKLYNTSLSAVATDNYITAVALTNGHTISGTSTSGTSVYTLTAATSVASEIKSLTLANATPGNEYIIEWTISYTAGNVSTAYVAYAYTGVKCPSLSQAGLVQYAYYDGFYTDTVGQTAYSFITGVDSVSGGNASSAFVNSSTSILPTSLIAPLVAFSGTANDGTNYTMPTGKDIVNNTTYFPSTSGGGVFRYYDNTSRSKVWYASGDDSNNYNPSSMAGTTYGNANITIDTSRFSNFNQLPNLSCGYTQLFHHHEGAGNYLYNIRNCTYTTSDAAAYWRNGKCEDMSTSSYIKTAATLYCSIDRTNEGSSTDNRSYVRGLYAINGAIPSSSGTTYMRYEYMNGYSPAIGSAMKTLR
jgi:hypothetical protein